MPWIPAVVAGGMAIYGATKSDSPPGGDADDIAQQKAWEHADAVKKGSFNFAGSATGATREAGEYNKEADHWKGDQAPRIDYTNTLLSSRPAQMDALGQLRDAANGTGGPSQAQRAMAYGNEQAMGISRAISLGARGRSAIAGAPMQTEANASAMQTNGANNMAALAARERATAQGQYASQLDAMRAADEQMGQFGASVDMRNRGINQQGQLGFAGLGKDVQDSQLAANMAKQKSLQADWMAQMANDQASKDRDVNTGLGIVNGVGQGFGGVSTS